MNATRGVPSARSERTGVSRGASGAYSLRTFYDNRSGERMERDPTVDWLAHLSEGDWFDAADFCAMMHRFRKATDSYGAL